MNKRRQAAQQQAKAAVNPNRLYISKYWFGLLLGVLCIGLYCFYFIAGGTLDPAKRAALKKPGPLAQQTGKTKTKVNVSQKSHLFHWLNY